MVWCENPNDDSCRFISYLFIRPDGWALSHHFQNDGQQCGGITPFHKLDVADLLLGIIHTEHPALFLPQLLATMVLCLHHDGFVDFYDLSNSSTAGVRSNFHEQILWRYWNHRTTVAEETPTWFVVCATLVSSAQKYIRDITFGNGSWLREEAVFRQRLRPSATRIAKHVSGNWAFLLNLRHGSITRLTVFSSVDEAILLKILKHLVNSANDASKLEDVHNCWNSSDEWDAQWMNSDLI